MMVRTETADIYENNKRRFIYVPLCLQETEYTCGIACLQSVLGSYGFIYRQEMLAKTLRARPILGTDYKEIINFVKYIGFEAYLVENMSIDNLKTFIDDNITPLLLIQAWADDGTNYSQDWSDAHYVIACGYDDNRIFFMDPYTLGNYTYIRNDDLKNRWHVKDEYGRIYYGTGIIIKNDHKSYIYNPSSIKYMK